MILANLHQRLSDNFTQQVWLAVFLNPRRARLCQLLKRVHWQLLKTIKHIVHNILQHLKLYILIEGTFSVRCSLLVLQHRLVVVLNYPQSQHFLLQHTKLFLLFLFLLMQVRNVIDGFLKDGRFADFISGGIILLARRNNVLQLLVTTFDGVPTLLFRLSVSLPTTLSITNRVATLCVVALFFTFCVLITTGRGAIK